MRHAPSGCQLFQLSIAICSAKTACRSHPHQGTPGLRLAPRILLSWWHCKLFSCALLVLPFLPFPFPRPPASQPASLHLMYATGASLDPLSQPPANQPPTRRACFGLGIDGVAAAVA